MLDNSEFLGEVGYNPGVTAEEAVRLKLEQCDFREFTRGSPKESDARQRVDLGEERWRVRGFQDAIKGSAIRQPWVIENLLCAQSGTLVSAQPHATKSLSWLQACLEAVAKRRVWGHFEAPDVKSALFIETEDPAWMVEARIRGFAKGLDIPEGDPLPGFHYACVGPFSLLGEETKIRDLIDKHCPQFMVLSTLQNLIVDADWKSQADMAPIMALIVRVARECPTVLVTHSPWDRKQRRAAGTITQAANFLTSLHYEKTLGAQGDTFVHINLDSKTGASETDFTLKLSTSGNPKDPESVRRLEYAGKGWPKGKQKQAIELGLTDDPDVSPQELADRVGCTVRYVQKVLKERKDRAE